MKLSDKKVQELKKLKEKYSTSSILENLYEKYLYTKKSGIENISKLLNENICSFQKIVNKCKSLKDKYNDPCLYKLLETRKLFEKLIQNNKLTVDDLKYLLSRIDKRYELARLSENTFLLKYMIDNNIVSFQELVDKYKSTRDEDDDSCLYKLLDNNNNLQHWIENNTLTLDDLKYLLNKINESYELISLCNNSSLIKYILNEFVLNKELVDRFNTIVENDKYDWYKEEGICDFFEAVQYYATHDSFGALNDAFIDRELLELNELNNYVCSFNLTKDQKLELYEILKDNETAQNKLIQIVDNNLEFNYDFEKLMSYLNKKEKKTILNI